MLLDDKVEIDNRRRKGTAAVVVVFHRVDTGALDRRGDLEDGPIS